MFKIDYNIGAESFSDIEEITDIDISYRFLQGNVVFHADNVIINMAWDWIPLLDFSFRLSEIAKTLTNKEKSHECFEFTESAETLKFYKNDDELKVIPSFSPAVIEIKFEEFNIEVEKFHQSISTYIKEKVNKTIANKFVNKYLST